MRLRSAPLLVSICLAASAACERRNTDCEWPEARATAALDLQDASDRRHLSDDASMAEDLAIHHADSHRGRRSGHFVSGAEYRRVREQCMATLFAEIGESHGVAPEQVREGLGHRRAGVDALIMTSFAALYVLVAAQVCRRMLQSSLGDQRWLALLAVVVTSIVFGLLGVLLGGVWAGLWEVVRIGNSHLSYRVARIPWRQHQPELFVTGALLFWVIAGVRYRALNRVSFRRAVDDTA